MLTEIYNIQIRYISRLLNYIWTIRRYVCPITSSVSLHSQYFKVVQGHVAPSAPENARSVSDSWFSCWWVNDRSRCTNAVVLVITRRLVSSTTLRNTILVLSSIKCTQNRIGRTADKRGTCNRSGMQAVTMDVAFAATYRHGTQWRQEWRKVSGRVMWYHPAQLLTVSLTTAEKKNNTKSIPAVDVAKSAGGRRTEGGDFISWHRQRGPERLPPRPSDDPR